MLCMETLSSRLPIGQLVCWFCVGRQESCPIIDDTLVYFYPPITSTKHSTNQSAAFAISAVIGRKNRTYSIRLKKFGRQKSWPIWHDTQPIKVGRQKSASVSSALGRTVFWFEVCNAMIEHPKFCATFSPFILFSEFKTCSESNLLNQNNRQVKRK